MFEMIRHTTNLAAVTSSLNRFHSFRSQTLFIFLSINTKLNVATFSSSLAQFVVFALKILRFFNNVIRDEQFHTNFSKFEVLFRINLPRICVAFNLYSQKFFELFQEFHFLRFWTSFHLSR